MKISISTGNIKMGNIPSISLPPGSSCPAGVPCFQDCYANKAYLIPARQAWQKNMDLYQSDPESFFIVISEYLSTHRLSVRFFRYHVGGDFPDAAYLDHCINLANTFKNVNFLSFTKRYELISKVQFPPNFTVIASSWPGLPMPRQIRKRFPVAWMQDGNESRVPKSALICPGFCDACGMCWQIRKLNCDVCFYKH